MNITKEYSKIINSEEFKEFKNNNPDTFISSAFLDEKGWQFNFFYKDKLITFSLNNEIINTEESEIYEKQKDLKELEIEKIKIDLEESQEIMLKVLEKENKKEEISKKIIILQQKEVPFWNLTYITTALNVFNLKINAISGEILEQKFENIMNFKPAQ